VRLSFSVIKNVVLSAILRLYPSRRIHGIRVVFADTEVDRAFASARLEDALELIKANDPSRYRRVLRYVKQLVLWSGSYSAASQPSSIQIGNAHFAQSDIPELASVIIHEATHLRIGRCGIPYKGALRGRVERRCVKEQAEFLRKCGEPGEVLASAYEDALQSEWWLGR